MTISSRVMKSEWKRAECYQGPVGVCRLSIPGVISASLSAFPCLHLSILPHLASVRDKLVTLCECKCAVPLRTVRKERCFFPL